MVDMDDRWVPVDVHAEDRSGVADHLYTLAARGEGMARDLDLRAVSATFDGSELTAVFRHARLGEFQVAASAVTVERPIDGDPADVNRRVADMARYGTWYVTDHAGRRFGTVRPADAGHRWRYPPPEQLDIQMRLLAEELAANPAGRIELTSRNALGSSSVTLTAERVTVTRRTCDVPPDACRACGSTRFRLRVPVTADVEAVGDGEFRYVAATADEWVGAARARNVLVSLTCAGCGTPHPAAGTGRLRGTNGGQDLAATPTVGDLLG